MNRKVEYFLKIFHLFFIIFFLISSTTLSNSLEYPEKGERLDQSFLILHVGGFGEGNFSSINEAINNSNNGDVIYVYDDSSPYYENIIINKSISLIGENKTTTFINGNEQNTVISIIANDVLIKGFTIKNCKDGLYYAGLK